MPQNPRRASDENVKFKYWSGTVYRIKCTFIFELNTELTWFALPVTPVCGSDS